MKTFTLTLVALALAGTCALHSEDTVGDRVRRILDKTKDKAVEIAGKVENKGRSWFNAAKENLRLSRPEYTDRAASTLARFSAQIQVLKELSGGPGQRDYFRTRVQALEQHAEFARTEFETLKTSESEEVFRARQKSFDRTLWTLEAAVETAQEEAGL